MRPTIKNIVILKLVEPKRREVVQGDGLLLRVVELVGEGGALLARDLGRGDQRHAHNLGTIPKSKYLRIINYPKMRMRNEASL